MMNWQGIVGEVVREISTRRSSGRHRPPLTGESADQSRPANPFWGLPCGPTGPLKKLYHGTFGWNSDAVARDGIVPGLKPGWSASEPQYVYLAESPELAANWVREAYVERRIPWDRGRATASVFEVDTAAIGPVEPDPKGGSADWRHKGAIPPSAIRLVYEADYTDDIPDEADYAEDEDMPDDDMPDSADAVQPPDA